MNRSRSQLDASHTRSLSLHKPGFIPISSRDVSPVSSNHHKYELKQKIWPKKTVESWFANHTTDDRRAVFSFLNTLYDDDDDDPSERKDRLSNGQLRNSPSLRYPNRAPTPVMSLSNHPLQRRMSSNTRQESRASKRDLGEILESLESYRPPLSVQEKGVQTSATPLATVLPNVNGLKNGPKTERRSRRSTKSMDRYNETIPTSNSVDPVSDTNDNEENNKMNHRYLSHSWRVINPREDVEQNVRPENNRSSFFNFTKKVYPEYFFIHPDWY